MLRAILVLYLLTLQSSFIYRKLMLWFSWKPILCKVDVSPPFRVTSITFGLNQSFSQRGQPRPIGVSQDPMETFGGKVLQGQGMKLEPWLFSPPLGQP